MLVAEGAVDIATEPQLELHDMAALDVIVREAGGVFTSLDGEPGPLGGSALATNGKLHDQALAFLGSLVRARRPPRAAAPSTTSARGAESRPTTRTDRVDPAGPRTLSTAALGTIVEVHDLDATKGPDEDQRRAQGQGRARA